MNVLFCILFTFFIVVIQTILLPSFSFFINCFDLMIINVIFLCLISSHQSVILGIMLIGIVMDSVSGAPFAYHLFTYLWIFILVSVFKQMFFQKSVVFVMVIGVVAIGIEQGLFVFSILVKSGLEDFLGFNYSLFIPQLLSGGIIIAPGVWMIENCYRSWIKCGLSIQRQWEKVRDS